MPRAARYILAASAGVAWVAYLASASPLVLALAAALTGAAIAYVAAGHRVSSSAPSPSQKPVELEDQKDSTPPPPERMHLTTPVDTTPEAVAEALLANGAHAGECVAAHVWTEDVSSGTLRQVAASGRMLPPSTPVSTTEGLLGIVLVDGTAHLEPTRRVTSDAGETTLWRYAFPVRNAGPRAVTALDFLGEESPDAERLNSIAAGMGASLAGAVSLAIAKRREHTIASLVRVAHALSRRLDPDDVVTETLAAAVDISHAATGSVMLLGDDGRLTIAAAHGLPTSVVEETTMGLGEGIAGWVAATEQPLLVEDLPGRDGRGERHGVRSAVSVPIADEDGLLGVLNVGSKAFPARYDQAHLDVLDSLGKQAAVALRNARALATAEDVFYGSLKALALALETKDPYSRGTTERVVDLCVGLGTTLGMDDTDLAALELAALLHDIGMEAAANAMSSPRPLTTVEKGLVTMHPRIAADILAQAPALQAAVPIVYHHHEHFDGRGYIDGLAGESIPLGSRVLSIVDAFVAMTSKRAYREAKSTDAALAELTSKAGTQFDPAVVSAFEEMLRGEENRVQESAE